MEPEGGGTHRREHDARLAFEQSSLPQAFADLEGRFIAVNSALIRLLGRSEQWLLGREVVSVLHPLHDPELRGQMSRLRHGAVTAVSGEVVVRHADGHSVQLLVDVQVLQNSDGTPRCVVLIAHDLTAVRSAEERLARQERLYRALSIRTTDTSLITDAELVVTFVSPAITDMLGHEPLDILSTVALDLMHPDDRVEVRASVSRVLQGEGGTLRRLVRLRNSSGEWRWSELIVLNSLADPDIGGLILNLRDVTAELEAQRAVRESEARYRAIVENAHEGIVAVDAHGRIELANDRIADILDLSPSDLRTSDLVQEVLNAARPEDGSAASARRTVRHTRPDGTERILSVSSSPLPGEDEELGMLVMISDVTEAHLLQERLQHQALHDQLTGLPNRYLFEDRLAMAASRQQRHPDGSTAVMYLDLDGFKEVNDTFGHAVGDELLARVGRKLVDTVRGSDTVARLGGDEFAIICEGLQGDQARAVAARIQDQVFESLAGGDFPAVNASIGIAMFPPHDPLRALALADTAMYQAKRLGGGGVIVFGADVGPAGS